MAEMSIEEMNSLVNDAFALGSWLAKMHARCVQGGWDIGWGDTDTEYSRVIYPAALLEGPSAEGALARLLAATAGQVVPSGVAPADA